VPFFFAWCGPDEEFGLQHQVEDEIVFAFDLGHQEGQIPTLSIDIKNPHVGLLAPDRAQWAWLSYQSSLGVFPLFYGRLVALPSNLLGEVVTLQFLARPNDYLAQKQDIADELMVEPFYDPIWINTDKLTDPDTVLETYAMTWHVDRITHEVSVSDIIFGEDGTEEFRPEESFYDSVSISFAQSPQTQVVFDGTVQWTQAATGVIPMPDVSLSAWNGTQIINDWPKVGDQLKNGWSVYFSDITNWSDQLGGGTVTTVDLGGGTSSNVGGSTPGSNPPIGSALTGTQAISQGLLGVSPNLPTKSKAHTISFSWQNQNKFHFDGDTMSINESATYDAEGNMGGNVVSDTGTLVIGDPATGTAASASRNISWTRLVAQPQVAPVTTPVTPVTVLPSGDTTGGNPVEIPSLFGQLWLQYDLSFGHTETIHFIMNSDIQPVVLLSPDESVNQITLSMNGSDLGLPLDNSGTVAPIGDPGRSAFFPTDRGLLAIQYPMLIARASLAQSARAAKVNFDCTFERALSLNCRKNALLHDLRLPGGQVIGKITEYHLKVDGDKGELIGSVQIESTVGNDTSITVNAGVPTYADEGYVAVGYQFYSGTDISLPTGDANVVMPEIVLPDNQMVLPLTFGSAVLAFYVHQGTPIDTVIAGGAATADPTWLEIALVPVTGQKFATDYDFGVSTLVLPKLIDLAAASA
jgi:hypothetical protein